MQPMQWNEEEGMKEHICMLLGSEKKLTELLGSENNPHLCHVKKPPYI